MIDLSGVLVPMLRGVWIDGHPADGIAYRMRVLASGIL
jgi:hypothetical protein